MRDGRARIDLWPLASFDHADGRLRGPIDPEHSTVAWVLGRSFAGIANRPTANELYGWMIAPSRTAEQRMWTVDVLKCAAAYPPQLVKLVRDDALCTYDLAVVLHEARCDYGLLTDWLNKYAIPPRGLPRPRPKMTSPRRIASGLPPN